MAFAKKPGRQEEVVAYADVALADIVSGTYLPMIDLPLNAVVTGGGGFALTAFNSATHDYFTIGDQTKTGTTLDSATATTYAAQSADFKTATGQFMAITPTGIATTKPTTVGLVWTGSGTAATTGLARLIVKYIVLKREEFSQG